MSYRSRFKNIRERNARSKRVVNNLSQGWKSGIQTIKQKGGWDRVKVTGFRGRLAQDLANVSFRDRGEKRKRIATERLSKRVGVGQLSIKFLS